MRILVFIGLKIIEIAVVVFVPLWLGKIFDFIFHNPFEGKFVRKLAFWVQGIMGIGILFVLGVFVYFLFILLWYFFLFYYGIFLMLIGY